MLEPTKGPLCTFANRPSLLQPITTVQEFVPLVDNAVSLGVMNLFMQLGIAVSVSVCQTVFDNRLPGLLHQYAPEIDVDLVFKAGVTGIRALIPAASMPGFLKAYNQALTEMFVSLPSVKLFLCSQG